MRESRLEPDSTRACRVWAQLAEIFGKAFYREHGETPGNLWVVAIEKLTDKEIRTGLANIANDSLAFPANLSQFVSACKHVPESRPWIKPNKNMGLVEDKRERGRMSRLEWMERDSQK